MHGLIFVTWEKYLQERFKGSILTTYRKLLGIEAAPALLAHRVYDDALLLKGVTAAHELTQVPVETLLQEFGRYFIVNGLTRNRCAYLLDRARSGRELLLAMHDAHEQMSRIPDGLTPPLFQYRIHPRSSQALVLMYDSPRKLCSVLYGALEGTAEYYEEGVYIFESHCMKKGDRVCVFEVQFFPSPVKREQTVEHRQRQIVQQEFARFLYSLLPSQTGLTLAEIGQELRRRGIDEQLRRPVLILQALHHLHHAGLVAHTANQPGDEFPSRRYWRVPANSSSLFRES